MSNFNEEEAANQLAEYPLQSKFVDASGNSQLLVHSDMPASGGQPRVQTNVKVCLIGNPKVGKTKMVHQLITGRDEEKPYLPTIGVEVHAFRFPDRPDICFNIWDVAGQAKFRGLAEGYYPGSDLGFVVLNPEGRTPYAEDKKAEKWANEFCSICDSKPVVYIHNVNALRSNLRSYIGILDKRDQQ